MTSAARYRIGYASSGLLAHRLEDALRLLADLGYRGVLLTLDANHLDPFAHDALEHAARVRILLDSLELLPVVETGARYVLDRHRKHHPTLLSAEGSERRIDYLLRSLRIADILGAGSVSFWSGALEANTRAETGWQRLADSLAPLLRHAGSLGLTLAMEPEPGMLVETVADFHRLRAALGEPSELRLSLDCGHLLVTGEGAPEAVLIKEQKHLAVVAIEDMRRGVHEHLPFGEGDLQLPALLRALEQTGFAGLVAVELGRHAHEGAYQAQRSRDHLRALGVPFRASTPGC